MDSLYWLVAQREKGLLPEKVFARGIRGMSNRLLLVLRVYTAARM